MQVYPIKSGTILPHGFLTLDLFTSACFMIYVRKACLLCNDDTGNLYEYGD